jgi:endonuclease YncB( thermonuclease family)
MRQNFRQLRVRNRGGVPFLLLEGHFIVRSRLMPDGDTLAFAAGSEYSSGPVSTNVPVDPSGQTSVSIRLQSIDAPEKTQPLGAVCRNQLLEHFGFEPTALGLSDSDFTANGDPVLKAGWLATHGMDGFGRPLGYLFAENPGFDHGGIVPASEILQVLRNTANFAQAANGWSFPAFYQNTDENHAALFQQVSEQARASGRGVWSDDATTTGFIPTKAATDNTGSLVYPKFYRRIADWPGQEADSRLFIRWLRRQEDGQKLVSGAEPSPIPLWKLFEQVDDQALAVPYDVTRLWFSE